MSIKPWKWQRLTRLKVMLFLTVIFFFIELIAGYAVGSIALVADSFHMLSDVLSLVVALYAINLAASAKNNPHLTYGYQRAEILGALTNGVFLLALCFTIILESIQRFVRPEPIDDPMLVLYVGCAGLVVNLLGLVLFHEHGHSHGHSHSHQHPPQSASSQADLIQQHVDDEEQVYPAIAVAAKIQDIKENIEHQQHDHHGHSHGDDHGHSHNLNMHGVFLHVLGDALASIAVIISATIIKLVPEGSIFKTIVDPSLSIIITIIILITTIPLVKNASYILLQGLPVQLRGKVEEIKQKIKSVPGVLDIHEFHIWQLSDTKWVATVHVLLDTSLEDSFMHVAMDVKECLHNFGIHSATVQPEFIRRDRSKTSNSTDTMFKAHQSDGGHEVIQMDMDSETTCLLRCENGRCEPAECCPVQKP